MRAQQQFDESYARFADEVGALSRLASQFDQRDVASIRRDDPVVHRARKLVQRVRIRFDAMVSSIPASAGGSRGAA